MDTKSNHQSREGGFIKIILIIVVILILLTIFKINLKEIINSPTTADNWNLIKNFLLKTWETLIFIWQNFIKEPLFYIWNDLFLTKIFPSIKEWLNR